jgi:hypothetical protein
MSSYADHCAASWRFRPAGQEAIGYHHRRHAWLFVWVVRSSPLGLVGARGVSGARVGYHSQSFQ